MENKTKAYSAALLYAFSIGFISFNLIAIIEHINKGTVNVYFKPFTNGTFLISILYLGLFSSLLTAFLLNYSLSYIEAAKVSVFSNLSTLITIIAGVLYYSYMNKSHTIISLEL